MCHGYHQEGSGLKRPVDMQNVEPKIHIMHFNDSLVCRLDSSPWGWAAGIHCGCNDCIPKSIWDDHKHWMGESETTTFVNLQQGRLLRAVACDTCWRVNKTVWTIGTWLGVCPGLMMQWDCTQASGLLHKFCGCSWPPIELLNPYKIEIPSSWSGWIASSLKSAIEGGYVYVLLPAAICRGRTWKGPRYVGWIVVVSKLWTDRRDSAE